MTDEIIRLKYVGMFVNNIGNKEKIQCDKNAEITAFTRILKEAGIVVYESVDELVSEQIKGSAMNNMDSCDLDNESLFSDDFPNPGNTFCIIDDRKTADYLSKNGYGFVVYITKHNSEDSFPDSLYAIESFDAMRASQIDKMLLRYLKLPWLLFKSDRCIIREMIVDDVDSFYDIYDDDEVIKYLDSLYEDRDKEIEYIEDYIKYQYRFYEYGFWTVIRKEDNKIIGKAGIMLREGHDTPELGFIFGKEYRGQGYAYEVCRGIIDYVREELELYELKAYVHPDNHRSRKLLEKLGFNFNNLEDIDGNALMKYNMQPSACDV